MAKWGLYLLAVGSVALILDDKATYVLLYSLAGVVFVSEYLLRDVAGRLRVSVSLDSGRVNYGEGTVLTVRIENPTRVAVPWVAVRTALPDRMLSTPRTHISSLSARGSVQVEYAIMGAKRGVYVVSDLEVGMGEGLREEPILVAGRPAQIVELMVYPKVWAVSPLRLPSRHPYGQVRSQVRYFEDMAKVIGVRDYTPGDNFKRINWKVSARVGELQTKEFQPTISLDTVILLDLDSRDYPPHAPEDFAELAIEVAASLAGLLTAVSESVGLMTNVGLSDTGPSQIAIRPAKGFSQLASMMDLLARVEVREGVDFLATVHAGRLGTQPGSTVVVIVPGERSDVFDSCLVLQKTGYKVLLVIIGGCDRPEAIQALVRQGVRLWHIFGSRDLERAAM